jgi:hypothetical protein
MSVQTVFVAGHCKVDCNITSHSEHYAIIKVTIYCKDRLSLDGEFSMTQIPLTFLLLYTVNKATKY